jgi:Transglycosylase SLT domain
MDSNQQQYQTFAQNVANNLDIPWRAFNALLMSESGYQNIPALDNNGNPIKNGGFGIGQLLESTANELGVDRSNPFQNITGSALYFKQQLDTANGDIAKAIAMYKVGPNASDAVINNAIKTNAQTILDAGGIVPQSSVSPANGKYWPGGIDAANLGEIALDNTAEKSTFDFNFFNAIKSGSWAALLLFIAVLALFFGIMGLK